VVRCSWQQGDPTVQVKMYDQSGRVVRNTPLSGGTGQIPIRDLPNGIYYYEITGRGWTKTGKLVH
jgi:hypothetical protein